ncbi:hypothetical protein CPC08DRAFT_814530, partial [Agrocybe pediades]
MLQGQGLQQNLLKPEEEEGISSRTTPRPSTSSPTDNPRSSADKPPKRAFPTAFTTPHDAILADTHGTSPRPGASDAPIYPIPIREELVQWPTRDGDFSPPSWDPREDTGQQRNDINVSSNVPPPDGISLSTSPQLLFDPYDGMSMGTLFEQDKYGVSDQEFAEAGGVDLVAWKNLARVLDIQSQISKMHMDMENIGSSKAGDSKNRTHHASMSAVSGTPAGLSGFGEGKDPLIPPGLNQPRKRAMSTVSTVSSSGQADDDEGVNVPNEEAEKLRIREEEFSKLAHQFEGRKEAINGIMSKLDDLSQAIYAFHRVQPPTPTASTRRSKSKMETSAKSGPSMAEDTKALSELFAEISDTTSNRTYEWAQKNAATSSSTLQAPPPVNRTVPDTKRGAPVQSNSAKKPVPILMLNSLSLDDANLPVTESPASSIGSVKPLPED